LKGRASFGTYTGAAAGLTNIAALSHMRFARAFETLALLIGPACLAAQPPAMSGVVHHAATGKPIECLHVALADSLGRTVAHTVTDASGTFVAIAPDTGTYRVMFVIRGLDPMQGPLQHLTQSVVTEQEYAVSFDDLLALDLVRRPPQPSTDLGEWRSAETVGGRAQWIGRRPATQGEGAYASTRSTDQQRVAAEFIVDSTGRPRGSSWRTIASSNPSIVQEARTTHLRQRYEPARIGPQPVCELVLAEVRRFRVPAELGR
jgi:hypothetical protein